MPSQDKRRRTRVSFQTLVTLVGPDQTLPGLATRDISLKGLFAITPASWPEGSPVAIRLLLAGLEEASQPRLAGRVARVGRDGLAIEFTELDPDGFTHLHKIVSYNSDDPDRIDREIGQGPVF
jgi:hypothetical protein